MRTLRSPLALLLWLSGFTLALGPARAAEHPFLDFDFEAPECAGGWYLGGVGYESAIDATAPESGRQSLRLRYSRKAPWSEEVFGVATQRFPVADAAGKTIRFSGWIRTEAIATPGGYAGLWWRVDGENGAQLAFDNMEKRGPHGTTPWTRYQIELAVPANAKQIVFGALLVGDGTAWFDDLRVETDGARWAEGAAPAAAPPAADAIAWLKAHAIPFDTPEAGHGFADLQPLKKLIGDAHVVALGEDTHGTREFFQMKHRLTEFLASEMGFTLFAIEANLPEAYKVNDYVLTGQGDPKALLKGMYFWTWDTQEVLDLIEWMRKFNQSGKGRIQFLGFDMKTPDVAARNVQELIARAEPAYAAEAGAAYAQVVKANSARQQQPLFGVGSHAFPTPAALAGKTLRLSGWIKTDGVSGKAEGGAGEDSEAILFTTAVAGGEIQRVNLTGKGAKGTADWRRFSLEVPVRAGVTTLNFGAQLKGKGTAWFDDLALEIDGVPYAPAGFELGFESGLEGWYTAGRGYEAALDSEVVHSGKHSLRLRYQEEPKTADPQQAAKSAAAAARQVLEHLEAHRGAYLAHQPPLSKNEIDWAIENARVVVQSAELAAGMAPRDRSMAENVEWIRQQAPPGAKIVLWAHNGHVNKANDTMGNFLAERYGKDMVVLGFAFGQGRYNAIGDQGLTDHEALGPVPGSVESFLHAAGLPRFVLDLRALPATSPAAPWLAAPHPFRELGAIAARCAFSPIVASHDFDGLIYFEATHPSVLLR